MAPTPAAAGVLGNRNVLISLSVLVVLTISGGAHGLRFKVKLHNNCPYPVWPAWAPSANSSQLCPGGTYLNVSQSYTLYPSTAWSGVFWGRTGCDFDKISGHGSCQTGDCGKSFGCTKMGSGPVTTVNFEPNKTAPIPMSLEYHVSLLHGFNIPIQISAEGASGCRTLGCPCDMTQFCPDALDFTVDNDKLGCHSPCDKLQGDKYCCKNEFSGEGCRPNEYSERFKSVCQDAVTYPSDFNTTKVVCRFSANYVITFCPDESTPRFAAI